MPRNPTGHFSGADAAPCLPRKTFDCEAKVVDDDGDGPGSFELYAACFNNVDRQGDIIEPGAFDNLTEFVKDGWIALNHRSMDLPIGIVGTAVQDARGLRVTGPFHSTEEAQKCRTVIRERKAAGKGVKCSIGYSVNEESYEKIDGRNVRRIKRLSVYEASIVNLPANPVAEVISAKGATPPAKSAPSEESMSEPETGVINALKRALGIDTKRSVAISEANREKLKGYCAQMDEHHAKMADCHKEMTKCHKCMVKSMDEMKTFLKGFEPTDTESDEEDEAGSPMSRDDEGDEEVPRRKPRKRKEEKPEDTADGDPPKSTATQEQKDLKVLREQLKTRALAGRAVQSCP